MIRFRRKKPVHRHRADYEGVLGTSLEINLVSASPTDSLEAEKRVLDEIDRLDAVFSIYKADSEFNQWQATRGEIVNVSPELCLVLFEAEHWREESKGAFLPVVEALTRFWKMREIGQEVGEPPVVDPNESMWKIDLERLTAIRLTKHLASLNAIAKGYIVDRAIESARSVESVSQVLINIGGDLRHWGGGNAQVSVSNPMSDAENAVPLCVVNVQDQAIATSGGYRRGFVVNGVRHSHVFNPTSGLPTTSLRSSSVIAKSAMLADIFATIVGVLPPDAGMAFADRFDSVGVMVVDSAGDCHENRFWKERRVAGGRRD